MADPIIEQSATAVDPTQSKSAFDLAVAVPTAPASSQDQPPAGVPAATASTSPPKSIVDAERDAFEAMEKEVAEALKAPRGQPAETPKAKPAETAKDKPALPPPIKAKLETPPKSDREQHKELLNLTEDELSKIPFEKWPRTAQDWKSAREQSTAQLNHYKQQVSALQQQLKSGTPEIKSIIEERDALRNELRAVSIERDPQFRAKHESASNNVRAQLESVLGKDDTDKALSIFKQPPGAARVGALEKMTEEMSTIKQSTIAAALMQHDTNERTRTQEIAEATKNWDKTQLETRAAQEVQDRERTSAFRNALKQTLDEWTDSKTGYEFMRRTGDNEKDAPLDAMAQLADAILTGENTPDEMARAAIYAALSPRLLEVLVERDSRISELEKELKSLRGSNPSPATGADVEQRIDSLQVGGYGDAIAAAVREAGLQMR